MALDPHQVNPAASRVLEGAVAGGMVVNHVEPGRPARRPKYFGFGRVYTGGTGTTKRIPSTEANRPPPHACASGIDAQGPLQPGHGLWLTRELADQMSISSGPGGSRVTAVFTLPPVVPQPGQLGGAGGSLASCVARLPFRHHDDVPAESPDVLAGRLCSEEHHTS